MIKNIKIFKNLYRNSIILSLPGFISIFLSLSAIPIHLKIAGLSNYGSYILFHIFLSLSFLLNFGISKTIVICSIKNKKNIKNISFEGIKYSFIVCLLILLIYFIFQQFFYTNIDDYIISLELFFFGIILSVLYLTFEGIIQAYKAFVKLSLFNFFYYSISLSLPSIFLLFDNNMSIYDLAFFSISIKFIVILFIVFFLIKNNLIQNKKNAIFYRSFIKNSPWLTLNSCFIQLYDMLDKYLIKIFIGTPSMAIYTIPQQLTGKLSILSKGFSAFLLPNINKRNKNLEFFFSIDLFLKYIPVTIFLFFPAYPYLLKFWLGNEYSDLILNLTKIFSLITIFSCISHILITKYEADQLSKLNSKIEITFLPFFLFGIIFLTSTGETLTKISILILIKELLLLVFRIYFLNIITPLMRLYYIFLFSLIFLLIMSFYNFKLFYIGTLILLFIVLKNVKQNNQKIFRKS